MDSNLYQAPAPTTIRPRSTAVAWSFGVLVCVIAVNTVGFPFYENPSRYRGLGYTGNDFGWPYTYLTTHLNQSQQNASRHPDGFLQKPRSIALPPQELMMFLSSDARAVNFDKSSVVKNFGVAVALSIYIGANIVMLSHLQPTGTSFSRRSLLILVVTISAVLAGSRSGYFYRFVYCQFYLPWRVAKWVALAISLCFTLRLVIFAVLSRRRQSDQNTVE